MHHRSWLVYFLMLSAAACSSSSHLPADGGAGGGAGAGAVPSAGSGVVSSAGSGAGPSSGGGGGGVLSDAELLAELKTVGALSPGSLKERYPARFESALGYDPAAAQGLERIAASSLALNESERLAFTQQGFTISDRLRFPHYVYGYKTLYFEHLPLFVSADSILHAVHRSYDSILFATEQQALSPLLASLLASLRARLPSAGLPSSVAQDLELYLSVPQGLLTPEANVSAQARALIAKAEAAQGIETITLFGSPREEDFSQFQPRGHYTEELAGYFRAMIWLGRIDFRMLETKPDHSRVLLRPAVDAALSLQQLMGDSERQQLNRIDAVIKAFVGEADYMTFDQLDALSKDLGASDLASALAKTDQQVTDAILAGGYGVQRIASHLMVSGSGDPDPLPNNLSFALLGQRYVIDSHVFSNVTFSRVPAFNGRLRMMPNPLDVAFAALGNNQALELVSSEVEAYGYAGQLGQTRVLVDGHPASYWDGSIYTQWLDALRKLSPSNANGRPSVVKTEAWGRRVLNTQLASWAELRHDTLLYAKQSYTGIPSCEYPDAYVDPYPEVFAALERLAQSGKSVVAALRPTEQGPNAVSEYFEGLAVTAARLRHMAEQQLSGLPHSAEDLAFINQAVKIENIDAGCTTVEAATGWYAKLFFNGQDALEADPTIADVHTQPADEAGAIVGNVLHVGTGYPRLMVVSIDTCAGPRAYAGVVSSYFEKTTSGFERLTDETWSGTVTAATPEDVGWMKSIVQR